MRLKVTPPPEFSGASANVPGSSATATAQHLSYPLWITGPCLDKRAYRSYSADPRLNPAWRPYPAWRGAALTLFGTATLPNGGVTVTPFTIIESQQQTPLGVGYFDGGGSQ